MTKTKTLHSFKADTIEEVEWDRPEMKDTQVEIKTLFCGVCRSDIGSYARWELMPYASEFNPDGVLGTFGHEAVGIVTAVGAYVTKTKIGDYVATWSDPGYAETYYATEKELTVIPEPDPKFILQPVACALNILFKTINAKSDPDYEVLLVGTGFMSIIIGQYCKSNFIDLTVVGNSNRKIWEDLGYELQSMESIIDSDKKYTSIIDLSSKAENFDLITKHIAGLEAVICYASTPTTPITTNFFENCWNCHTIIMPSPRNSDFDEVMEETRDAIINDEIDPSIIWSKEYDRHNIDEVKQAFEDGKHRPPGYLRGYLKF